MRTVNKASECVGCKVSFELIKYHSRNMCSKCYHKDIYSGLYKVKKEANDACKVCNLKYGDINKKGKEIQRGAQGYCRRCYANAYNKHKQNGGNFCKRCNEPVSLSKEHCNTCRWELSGKKDYKRKPNNQIKVDYETYELMRRLFYRFKEGKQTPVDHLRVADLYIQLFLVDAAMDGYNEIAQVVLMLKRLKMVWDWNRAQKN